MLGFMLQSERWVVHVWNMHGSSWRTAGQKCIADDFVWFTILKTKWHVSWSPPPQVKSIFSPSLSCPSEEVLILFISITQVLSSDPESPSTVDQADSVVVEYNDFIKVYGIWGYKGSCNYSPSNANRINYKICKKNSAEHPVNRKTNQLWKKSCIELPKYLIFIRVKLKSSAKFWVFLRWFLNFTIFDFVPSIFLFEQTPFLSYSNLLSTKSKTDGPLSEKKKNLVYILNIWAFSFSLHIHTT